MLAADVENYLMEIARTLKPDGTALITWYLLDEVSRTTKKPALDFRYKFDEVSWTTVKSTPEAAIAFDVDFVKSLYAKAGLSIETIEHGYWARPDAPYMLQDMIVARKTI
jgi:SAM-dependent methyltransferase